MADETIVPDEQQDADNAPAEQIPDDKGSEADQTPLAESSIPMHRFREVIKERNEAKTTLETLQKENELLKSKVNVEDEQEPSDWKEVERRAVDKAVGKIKTELEKKEEEEIAYEQKIENNFSYLQKLGHEITKDIKREVLTEMIESENENVIEVFLKVKERTDKQAQIQQQKSAANFPSSQKGQVNTKGFSYSEIKGKSIDDIIG